jgi:hypothetical protein
MLQTLPIHISLLPIHTPRQIQHSVEQLESKRLKSPGDFANATTLLIDLSATE